MSGARQDMAGFQVGADAFHSVESARGLIDTPISCASDEGTGHGDAFPMKLG